MPEKSVKDKAKCPTCDSEMRREINGVRVPPTPGVFWFCINLDCEDGSKNRIFSGG